MLHVGPHDSKVVDIQLDDFDYCMWVHMCQMCWVKMARVLQVGSHVPEMVDTYLYDLLDF